MRKMRTAEEMANYCLEKGTALKYKLTKLGEWSYKWLEKQFCVIEDALNEDEYVVCCFVAERHITAYVDQDETYVYALTNKRLLNGFLSGAYRRLYMTSYKDLNTIDVGKRNVLIDSIKAEGHADVCNPAAINIKRELQPILEIIQKQKTARERANRFTGSIADELIKFKQLRDEGVLTDAEFQKQKELLLNPGWDEFIVDFDSEEDEADKKTYRVKRPLRIHKKK